MKIEEKHNDEAVRLTPVRETMDIFLDKITMPNVPNRNGFITLFSGAPGSGKSSLLLSMLKSKAVFKKQFKHIFYFVPEASYMSVVNHPLTDKDNTLIFHELDAEALDATHDYLIALRKFNDEMDRPQEHSLLIIDDFANDLKNIEVERALKKILVKSRHLMVATAITLQGYIMAPLSIRKLASNIILFKPQNQAEWKALIEEHLSGLEKKDTDQLFKYAFDEPYAHLDIDTKKPAREMFSKNFNQLTLTT
jgi:hypothetical protein